jgi:hypothetical protein
MEKMKGFGKQYVMNLEEGKEGPDGIIPIDWNELDDPNLFPKSEGIIGISPPSYTATN